MPKTHVVFYKEDDGTCLTLEWLNAIPPKAMMKCRAAIARLSEHGHELRRPEADLLRDNIYELRVRLQGIHYRLLYFFHGNMAAVGSHGIVKERAVPPFEIERAILRKKNFTAKPATHSHGAEVL